MNLNSFLVNKIRMLKISLFDLGRWAKFIPPLFMIEDREKPIVFVIGTGRSGTHFMDSVLISNPDFTDLTGGVENRFVFDEVTRAALFGDELKCSTLIKFKALKNYAAPKILVDQSHPNIWHVEHLIARFPAAKFVGMVRDPLSVTYSTLNHSGVVSWIDNYTNFPVPNRFLGINKENLMCYAGYSLAQRSALRWAVHMARLDEVKRKYPNSVFVMNYEMLCAYPEQQLRKLADFLGAEKFESPVVEKAALHKKDRLKEKAHVLSVIEEYFSSNPLPDESNIPLSGYLSLNGHKEECL